MQLPQVIHFEEKYNNEGLLLIPSGFEHQKQLSVQPFRNINVLQPGPSCTDNPWISKI